MRILICPVTTVTANCLLIWSRRARARSETPAVAGGLFIRRLHGLRRRKKTKSSERNALLLMVLNLWNLRNLRIGRLFLLLTAHCLLLTVLWWRRRELNSDPKVNAEGLYMLSCFSFRVPGTHASGVPILFSTRGGVRTQDATFAHLELSESARRSNGLVRLWSRPRSRTESAGQLI
jgi:hypothetical protein